MKEFHECSASWRDMWGHLLRLIVIGFLLMPAGAAQENKVSKKWVDEDVPWIIGRDEKKAFKKLKNDEDRAVFVEEFWTKRDPTPGTAKNENKEEHYRRIKFATEEYSEGIKGWRTDRGRVYIIHGEPHSRRQLTNEEHWIYGLNRYGEYSRGGATLIFRKGGIDSRGNVGQPGSARPGQGVPEGGAGRFEASMGQLGRSTIGNRFTLVDVIPIGGGSGVKEQYIADFFRSPGDYLEDKWRDEARRRGELGQVKEQVKASVSFGEPLDMGLSHWALKSDAGISIVFALQVPVEQLQPTGESEAVEAVVDALCELHGSDSYLLDSFEHTFEFGVPGGSPSDVVWDWFESPVGDYQLTCTVRDDKSGRVGQSVEQIDGAGSVGQTLAVSEPILTQLVTQKADQALPSPVDFQSFQIHPRARSEFDRTRPIVAFFEIYGEGLVEGEEQQLFFDYKIYTSEKVFHRSPLRPVSTELHSPGKVPSALQLDLSSLPSGEYSMLLKVFHAGRKQSAMKRVSFELK